MSNRSVSLAMYEPAAAKACAREAAGNVKAMAAALDQADAAVPLSTASILQLHQVLLGEDDRGIAGRLRDETVWVGGATPVDAIFVPPPHEHVPALLEDLGAFAARDDVDRIAKAALVHTLPRADDLTTRTTVPVVTVVLNEADGNVGNARPK